MITYKYFNYKTFIRSKKFSNIIFRNFFYLSDFPILKHSINDINILLSNKNMHGFFALINNKIIGYIISEFISLDDKRKVLFINYIYVSPKFRNQNIGTLLINKIYDIGKKFNLNALMLICDTENFKIFDMYQKRGFMLDLILRRYDRFDVLTKNI